MSIRIKTSKDSSTLLRDSLPNLTSEATAGGSGPDTTQILKDLTGGTRQDKVAGGDGLNASAVIDCGDGIQFAVLVPYDVEVAKDWARMGVAPIGENELRRLRESCTPGKSLPRETVKAIYDVRSVIPEAPILKGVDHRADIHSGNKTLQ